MTTKHKIKNTIKKGNQTIPFLFILFNVKIYMLKFIFICFLKSYMLLSLYISNIHDNARRII